MSFFKELFNIIAEPRHKPPTSSTSDTQFSSLKVVRGDVHMATLKITKMLNRTGEDFCTLFSDIECAENKGELEKAL